MPYEYKLRVLNERITALSDSVADDIRILTQQNALLNARLDELIACHDFDNTQFNERINTILAIMEAPLLPPPPPQEQEQQPVTAAGDPVGSGVIFGERNQQFYVDPGAKLDLINERDAVRCKWERRGNWRRLGMGRDRTKFHNTTRVVRAVILEALPLSSNIRVSWRYG